MREIKFRAWDGTRMCQVLGLTCSHDHMDLSKDDIEIEYGSFLNGEKVELMQFTGLVDKNGVDIYEGDIVTVTEMGSPHEIFTHEVKHDGRGWEPFDWADGHIDATYYYSTKPEEIAVVGNIYENSDLLENRE